ncbi:MAG: NAD(P)H-dependent oxidoreductase subunit E [Bacillota bacterium]
MTANPQQAQPLSKIEKLNAIVARHGGKVSNLVAMLQDIQGEYRYLPEETLAYVANALDLPPAIVFGVGTFYSQFTLEPRGRFVIKVCDGTACHVRGSEKLNYAIREAAGLSASVTSSETTADLKFTVERVACVGACGLAPVVMVNDKEVYGNLTPAEATQLVLRLAAEEALIPPAKPEPPAADLGQAIQPKPSLPDLLASRADLDRAAARYQTEIEAQKIRLLVCMETACIASGAQELYDALSQALDARGLKARLGYLPKHGEGQPVHPKPVPAFPHHQPQPAGKGEAGLIKAGCHGYCQLAPLVVLEPGRIVYARVKPEDANEIVTETVLGGRIIPRLLYQGPNQELLPFESQIPFYANQEKIAMATCGRLDSEDIREYLAFGGYQALARALFDMTPEQVVAEVKAAGLRGRGGGGFLTGVKWDACRQALGDKKYIVCNADEGDPGAFMDRSLLEGDPHRVLEGIALAAYAVGADEAYIYLRAEYPLAVSRTYQALKEAKDWGLLGENILGSSFSLNIRLKEGAGAFVCGEETALLASIEGQRGMPRPRPPFPAVSGLWGKPTVINNVETLALVPYIIKEGAAAFRQYGTPTSPGTKTFALAGQVARTGLVEVAMGTPLRKVVFDIGGGMRREYPFKAVQIGGPSGGCLTAEHLELPLDYESLKGVGAMVGSGGLVVMDEGTCMVEIARFFMNFIQEESCGKCIPCREGSKKMLEILERITTGQAKPQDLGDLERLANVVANASLCGLGKTAPNPVLSTLRYFREEYRRHIEEKCCPAGVCEDLLDYLILPDKCTGCGVCVKVCRVNAIRGERKQPHIIEIAYCIKCGACAEKCKFQAITRSSKMKEVV